jgi:hypothetical protein
MSSAFRQSSWSRSTAEPNANRKVLELSRREVAAGRCRGPLDREDRQGLKLVEATPFETGVVLLRYEIKK